MVSRRAESASRNRSATKTAAHTERNRHTSNGSATVPPRVATLQRSVGNRAVQSMIRDGRRSHPSLGRRAEATRARSSPSSSGACPQCVHRRMLGKPLNCAKCESVLGGRTGESADRAASEATVQPKLTVTEPNDEYEREADRVAETVMRMPDSTVQRQETEYPGPPSNGEQREEEEDEEGVAPTAENVRELEETNVAPKREPRGRESATDDSALRDAVERTGAGRPLHGRTREFMERRFGRDFSRVRVHTDGRAHVAARSIRARAFTSGRDIWFSRGEYAPESDRGKHLIAHELTHTLQQRSGVAAGTAIQRSICPDNCQGPVSRGELCRADSVTRDNCGERGAADDSNKISHIRVLLDARRVHLFWNGTPRTAEGRKEELDCTPNSSETPSGWDKVGVKCGPNHTSWARYNMAWFTAFRSHGYRYGFHDSQPLGPGQQSAGCVRVSCEAARRINQNTVSDWTSIMVRNSSDND